MRSIQTVNGHHISIERRSEERWLLVVDGHHVGLNRGDAEWLNRDLVAEVLSVDADALYSEERGSGEKR